jgi:hypothetical protein
MKRQIKKLNAMPYAQAHIEIIDDTQYLFSYTTLVATIRTDEDGERWIRCYGLYSLTTRKHISAFAKENGLTFKDFKERACQDYEFNADTGEVVLDEDENPYKK